MGVQPRISSYSRCIATYAWGRPQRGVVQSVFAAATNLVFPSGLMLSLNAASSPQMPNGLQLSADAGTFPFSALSVGIPVLFGAQRLHIEALNCSFDLSLCEQWESQIEHPAHWNVGTVKENGEWLRKYVRCECESEQPPLLTPDLIHHLCGRGVGLTPAGDDILAGWMAAGWLLYGPRPSPAFLAICQQIVALARRQTNQLSLCWLSYAAQGNVASPIRALLAALTRELPESELVAATEDVLKMGATSGYDIIQGIVFALFGEAIA